MVSRLIAKGANVFAVDRDGRDALEYLQFSVQQHQQSDRLFHESGREILFVLQKTRAKMEIAQQRQALRHHHQQTSPSSPHFIQPSQHIPSSSPSSSSAAAAPPSASAAPPSSSSDVEGGNELGNGEAMGDDYVVDIYCRDMMDMGSPDFSDAVADGQGLAPGLGLGSTPGLGLGLDQGPRLGRIGDDLVHLSATATVVQVPYHPISTQHT